jgi:dihydrofolate reductase
VRSVIYSMGVSLDGYIVGPDGGVDWTAPDQELFRFVADQTRELAAYAMGRRLYETSGRCPVPSGAAPGRTHGGFS